MHGIKVDVPDFIDIGCFKLRLIDCEDNDQIMRYLEMCLKMSQYTVVYEGMTVIA